MRAANEFLRVLAVFLIFLTLKLVCVEKSQYLSRLEVNAQGFMQRFSDHGHGISSISVIQEMLEMQILGPRSDLLNQQFVLTSYQVILMPA